MEDFPRRSNGRKRSVDPIWDAKDEVKRRNWRDQEIITMLNLIKKHNLLEHSPTDAQLGETLVKPMLNLGYSRTAHQIKLKVKSLRKSFARSKRGNLQTLKSCSFYGILDSLYGNIETKLSDSEEEQLEAEDSSNIWSESEVKRMLMIIRQTDLAHELSVGAFPIKALRQIHRSLQNSKIIKNIEQIRTALMSMRNAYVKYKTALANGKTDETCPYFEYLDSMWKRDYSNGHFHMINDREEFWSEEETIVLLESIKESGLVEEAQKCSDVVAHKIQEALNDSGYNRSKFQIVKKLENLKQNYAMVKQCTALNDAIAKFPFYHRYESVFGVSSNHVEDEEFDIPEKLEFDDLIVLEKKKHFRGYQWINEEVRALLDLVKDLRMDSIFHGRMTLDYVSQLSKPLEDRGYYRTTEQIKIKLKCLKNQYYRCLQQGCTPNALSECPYFERIQAFVKKDAVSKVSPVKRQGKRKDVLMDIVVDENDQSYGNGLNEESSCNFMATRTKHTNIAAELWEPVETIVDEEINEKVEEADEDEDDRLSEMSFEEVIEDECENKVFNQAVTETYMSEINNSSHEDFIEYSDLNFTQSEKLVAKCETPQCETIKQSSSISSADVTTHSTTLLKEQFAFIDANVQEDSFEKSTLERGQIDDTTDDLQDQESPTSKTTPNILLRVLKHESLLQEQHHLWLEKQFEIQRKHDQEQRAELLNELQELRRAITSSCVLYQQN